MNDNPVTAPVAQANVDVNYQVGFHRQAKQVTLTATAEQGGRPAKIMLFLTAAEAGDLARDLVVAAKALVAGEPEAQRPALVVPKRGAAIVPPKPRVREVRR